MTRNGKSLSLAANVFYNIAGQGLPVLAAAFSIPVLIHSIGTDRFGLLTIAWMVVGYFNLFDLGLGRALTKLTSDRLGANRNDEVPVLVSAGLTLMLVLGVLAAAIVGLFSSEITRLLHTPVEYAIETRNSFWLLAANSPAIKRSVTGIKMSFSFWLRLVKSVTVENVNESALNRLYSIADVKNPDARN